MPRQQVNLVIRVTLCLHGALDDIVPLRHGRGLFESVASGYKIFTASLGGHNDLISHPGYFGCCIAFIQNYCSNIVKLLHTS